MIADLKPYPAMKDSGVEWLEEVPEHWDLRRGKSVFRSIDIRSQTGEEELLTVSSARGIVPRRSASVTMFKAESYVGHKLCWPGDLVINSLWAWARGLGVSSHHGIVSTAYGVYRPKVAANPKFIHELLRSTPFHWELRVRSKGVWTSRLQLTDDSFLGAPILLPPLPEQEAIVRFIDYISRRIRWYIRAKQTLIKLLEEQKQAVIHQAVTGQIDVRTGNPYPTYKLSGIEWLGDVPKHWEVTRFKRVAGVSGVLLDSRLEEQRSKTLIAPNHIERNGTSRLLKRETADEQGADSGKYEVRAGEIIYCKIRPYLRKGVIAPIDCLCSADMYPIALKENADVTYDFLLLEMLSLPFTQYTIDCSLRAAMPKINREALGEAPVWLPPLPEQAAITKYLAEATVDIDATVKRGNREIELLNEYRTRLIADVVTGKLDVREAAASLPDEPDDLEEEGELDELIPDETDVAIGDEDPKANGDE